MEAQCLRDVVQHADALGALGLGHLHKLRTVALALVLIVDHHRLPRVQRPLTSNKALIHRLQGVPVHPRVRREIPCGHGALAPSWGTNQDDDRLLGLSRDWERGGLFGAEQAWIKLEVAVALLHTLKQLLRGVERGSQVERKRVIVRAEVLLLHHGRHAASRVAAIERLRPIDFDVPVVAGFDHLPGTGQGLAEDIVLGEHHREQRNPEGCLDIVDLELKICSSGLPRGDSLLVCDNDHLVSGLMQLLDLRNDLRRPQHPVVLVNGVGLPTLRANQSTVHIKASNLATARRTVILDVHAANLGPLTDSSSLWYRGQRRRNGNWPSRWGSLNLSHLSGGFAGRA
mmetsp:Transcript_27230/g.65582  ORF Transcript_27230/g.65582 Transcript_27230/m.65582 type:complete len:343 (-) Transcript_27230:216-1244(-)